VSLAAASALLLAALVLPAAAGEPPAAGGAGPQVTLLEADSGREVSLPVGALLAIELQDAPVTGHVWSFSRFDGELLEVVWEGTFPPAARRAVGTPGLHRWTIRALRPGTTRLELRLARPWESGDPLRVFGVGVTVTDR
jgi:predicted secreted protein